MNELDKWSAEACSVDLLLQNSDGFYWKTKNSVYRHYPWTLTDPRCMELFRKRFELATYPTQAGRNGENWTCEYKGKYYDALYIKEAELACAKAIMEAEK